MEFNSGFKGLSLSENSYFTDTKLPARYDLHISSDEEVTNAVDLCLRFVTVPQLTYRHSVCRMMDINTSCRGKLAVEKPFRMAQSVQLYIYRPSQCSRTKFSDIARKASHSA